MVELGFKLLEILGVVATHNLVEHFVTERETLVSGLMHAAAFPNRPLRVSMAQILSLNSGEKFILVESKRRKDWFTPFGGVIHYFPSGASQLQQIGFRNETKNCDPCDLRGYIDGANFNAFLRWYNSGENREQLALAREIEEELREIGINDAERLVRRLEFRKLRVVHETPQKEMNRGYWQYRRFEVFSINEEASEGKLLADFLRSELVHNSKLTSVGIDDLENGRTATGQFLGNSAGYVFSQTRKGFQPLPLV